ncbi:MAG TPA: DUF4352 domain-containing protein [Ktedonobacterales bacterium]|nr:DUF4352 domain-containing protein [Ktedonobacterales bacterium]
MSQKRPPSFDETSAQIPDSLDGDGGGKAPRSKFVRFMARLNNARRLWIIVVVVALLLAVLAIPIALIGGRFIGHHKVGEKVQVGSSWAITVTSVTTSQSLEGAQTAKGYVYLVVNLSVRNVSLQPQSLGDLSFFGPFDASGKTYPGSISLNGTVAPSTTKTGTLVAEIPTSLHKVTIECDDQNENSLSNIWDINVP